MVPSQFIDDFVLRLATGGFSLVLIAAFIFQGIHRLYPVFFCYCLLDVAMTAAQYWPGRIETANALRLGLWLVQWVFYFLLVLELMDRILSDHPSLSQLGKRAVQVIMIAAVCAAISSLRLDSGNTAHLDSGLHLFFQTERVIAGCLLIFMVLINLFLWFFPVRLSRNTKAYCWGFTIFFLVKAIAPIVVNWGGLSALDKADDIHLGGMVLCELVWIFSITKRGVERTPAFPRHWTDQDREKVLSTLTAFEQQISRTRGR